MGGGTDSAARVADANGVNGGHAVNGVLNSLDSELLQMIADQARRAPPRMLSAALFVAVILMPYVPVWLPGMWLLAVALVTTGRTLMLVSLPSEPSLNDQQKLVRAAIIFTVSGATQASVLAFF